MDYIDSNARGILKDNLLKLNKHELKLFYGVIVHHWASCRAFISRENFHNLWHMLNYFCYIFDDKFPNPFENYDLLRSFSHAHPYHFIDVLPPEHIINLLCHYVEDHIDVLAIVAYKLKSEGLRDAYEYSINTLGLSEDIDELTMQAEEHIKFFS